MTISKQKKHLLRFKLKKGIKRRQLKKLTNNLSKEVHVLIVLLMLIRQQKRLTRGLKLVMKSQKLANIPKI